MSLLVITLFTFVAALSLVLIIFMLPMAVQNTPQARIRRQVKPRQHGGAGGLLLALRQAQGERKGTRRHHACDTQSPAIVII